MASKGQLLFETQACKYVVAYSWYCNVYVVIRNIILDIFGITIFLFSIVSGKVFCFEGIADCKMHIHLTTR